MGPTGANTTGSGTGNVGSGVDQTLTTQESSERVGNNVAESQGIISPVPKLEKTIYSGKAGSGRDLTVKFNGSNFSHYKIRLRLLLTELKLISVLENDDMVETTDGRVIVHPDHEERKIATLVHMIDSMEPDVAVRYESISDPVVLWEHS